MHNHMHPEPEQLDRLRAGLLDDQPEAKAALEAHVSGCEVCQARGSWHLLQPGNLGPDFDTDTLQLALRKARLQALQAGDRRRHYEFAPYATAALLLIAVFIGIWTLQPDGSGQQQMAAQDVRMIPDVYEDLDFYLWLANQKEDENGNEDTQPNNT